MQDAALHSSIQKTKIFGRGGRFGLLLGAAELDLEEPPVVRVMVNVGERFVPVLIY